MRLYSSPQYQSSSQPIDTMNTLDRTAELQTAESLNTLYDGVLDLMIPELDNTRGLGV